MRAALHRFARSASSHHIHYILYTEPASRQTRMKGWKQQQDRIARAIYSIRTTTRNPRAVSFYWRAKDMALAW